MELIPATLQFHFYAAEEGGLLGSKDVVKSYVAQGIPVKAMLQFVSLMPTPRTRPPCTCPLTRAFCPRRT